jgi:hypothetical protein
MPETPNVLRFTIESDLDAEDPSKQEGSWSVVTFGDNRILTDRNRESFFDDDDQPDEELARKLQTGLAFGLRYTCHGADSLYATYSDTSGGLVFWENGEDEIGAKTVEDRRADADRFLEKYTDWANGHCHYIKVERIKSVAPDYDPDDASHNGAFWETVDSYGTPLFIGDEKGINDFIAEVKRDYSGPAVIIQGDAAWIVD